MPTCRSSSSLCGSNLAVLLGAVLFWLGCFISAARAPSTSGSGRGIEAGSGNEDVATHSKWLLQKNEPDIFFVMPPPNSNFKVYVENRQIVERLLNERRRAGFDMRGLIPHPFHVFRAPNNRPPSLSIQAANYLQLPDTRLSVDRHLTSTGALGPSQTRIWHLMTPAPETPMWQQLIDLRASPMMVHRQPMLIYELHYNPDQSYLQHRLLGVEIEQLEETPQQFLSRWSHSRDIHSFADDVHDIRSLL